MVAIGIAGIKSAGEDIVDNPDRVGDITCIIAVNIAGFERIGSASADKNIIYYMHSVADIHLLISVSVATDIWRRRRLGDIYAD